MLHSAAIHSSLEGLPYAEKILCSNDAVLAQVIEPAVDRWSAARSSNLLWGLIGVIASQQISTKAALSIRAKIAQRFSGIAEGLVGGSISADDLRACGLSPRKAECCAYICANAETIVRQVESGCDWEQTLLDISGIGPWTITIFRMLVLREPDLLPSGDLGLERAFAKLYPPSADLRSVSNSWKPFRSVACWYLWRSLGNPPLG